MANKEIDGILELIVEAIENSDKDGEFDLSKSTSVTLLVGGSIVCGKVISTKYYLSRFLQGAILKKYNELEESGEAEKIREESGENIEAKSEKYIHLTDVRFVIGSRIINLKGVGGDILWRGKTSKIEGFMLGDFSLEE